MIVQRFYLKRKTNGIRAGKISRRITLLTWCNSRAQQCPFVTNGSAASSALVTTTRESSPFVACATGAARRRNARTPDRHAHEHKAHRARRRSPHGLSQSRRYTRPSTTRHAPRPPRTWNDDGYVTRYDTHGAHFLEGGQIFCRNLKKINSSGLPAKTKYKP